MALDDAVSWQVLEEIQRTLREDIRFEPQRGSTVSAITPDAIVIRKLSAPKPDLPAQTDERLPGILISPAVRVERPAHEGWNDREDIHYHYLIQIIATDYERCENNLPTYMKWEEQIARLMSHWFAVHPIVSGGFGCVWDSVATVIQVVDPKKFVRHQRFVGGVVVTALAKETRGITE